MGQDGTRTACSAEGSCRSVITGKPGVPGVRKAFAYRPPADRTTRERGLTYIDDTDHTYSTDCWGLANGALRANTPSRRSVAPGCGREPPGEYRPRCRPGRGLRRSDPGQ